MGVLLHLCAVHRPLPKLVEPLLEQNLASILKHLEDSFPPAAACQAQRLGEGSAGSWQAEQQHGRHLALVDSDDEEAAGECLTNPSILSHIRFRTKSVWGHSIYR